MGAVERKGKDYITGGAKTRSDFRGGQAQGMQLQNSVADSRIRNSVEDYFQKTSMFLPRAIDDRADGHDDGQGANICLVMVVGDAADVANQCAVASLRRVQQEREG